MNQLENAFGDNDSSESKNGIPNPVVILGQPSTVWLGPKYDETQKGEGQNHGDHKDCNNRKQPTWEMINRQIQQNMAGNVSVLKEMVSGLERGETRMELFGTATDHLHQKIVFCFYRL